MSEEVKSETANVKSDKNGLPDEVKIYMKAMIKYAMTIEFIKGNFPERVYNQFINKATPEQKEFVDLWKLCRIDTKILQAVLRKDYKKIITTGRNIGF